MTTVKTETQTKQQPRVYGKILLSLENCILPEIDKKPTPSEQDGLNVDTETDLRILGCELIQTAGILLRIPQVAMATGQVLFQRFFYSKSFVRHSMEAVAMSCVCLASKIEEAPRRIRDVINVFHHIKQVRAQKPLTPMILDQNYINLKSQVIKAERRVLKELGFCVHVKHPHKLIVMYLKYLEYEQHQQMMQMAWNFMNDSFRTDVFVRYQPEKIACACIYLTARKLGIPLPNNPPWYGVFKTTEDEIVDICYRILTLYRRSKPNIEKLEEAVDRLKQAYQEQRKKDKGGNHTPPSLTVPDRNNGAHNAWGGFIARAEPLPVDKEKDRSRSRSRSRSSRSGSPDDDRHRRKRSRTPLKKKKRYSRSPSMSPRKHKKIEKKYDRTPERKDRHSNGDRKREYDYYDDRDYEYSKSYKKDYKDREYKEYKEYKDYKRSDKDRYYNGKDKYRNDNRIKHRERSRSPRDRDRRR